MKKITFSVLGVGILLLALFLSVGSAVAQETYYDDDVDDDDVDDDDQPKTYRVGPFYYSDEKTPIEDGEVILTKTYSYRQYDITETAVTDSEGYASFTRLGPGNYDCTVTKDGKTLIDNLVLNLPEVGNPYPVSGDLVSSTEAPEDEDGLSNMMIIAIVVIIMIVIVVILVAMRPKRYEVEEESPARDGDYGYGYDGGEDWSEYADPNEYECPNCGGIVGPEEMECPHCGAEFEPDVFRCPNCDTELSAEDTSCSECGYEFPKPDDEMSEAESLADDGYDVVEIGADGYEVEEAPQEMPMGSDDEEEYYEEGDEIEED